MKITVEKDVDIEQLLAVLNEKSRYHNKGMAGSEVTIEKQVLRDAHDVIKYLQSENRIAETAGRWILTCVQLPMNPGYFKTRVKRHPDAYVWEPILYFRHGKWFWRGNEEGYCLDNNIYDVLMYCAPTPEELEEDSQVG